MATPLMDAIATLQNGKPARAAQTTSGRSWHWAPAIASRLLQWGQGLARVVEGAITAPHTLQ